MGKFFYSWVCINQNILFIKINLNIYFVDIDECARSPCLQLNSTCQNSQGSYYCNCDSGLQLKKFANGSYVCVGLYYFF